MIFILMYAKKMSPKIFMENKNIDIKKTMVK
jgi:hypothetical protein